MVITKIEYKKDGKNYNINCCNEKALTVADVYAEGKLIKVEASMPSEVFYFVDVLTFVAPLEEMKIYDDTGVLVTIKDVYDCTSDFILSAGNDSVAYVTIKGKDYVTERLSEKQKTSKPTEPSLSLKNKKERKPLRGLRSLIIPAEEAKISTILYNDKKEKRAMNISNIFGTDNLGKVNIDSIKYSIKGIAFLTEGGTYCVYDVDTLAATDVSNFVFDTPVFILPVAAKDIYRGDIIYYNQMPYIVRAVKENCIAVINPFGGKLENLIPKTSILGFSFYSKVICPFNLAESNPTTMMNNLLPLLLMGDKSKDKDNSDLLMMMTMMNGGKSDFNSLLPLMLMNDKSDKSDTMMMLMMMNNNSFAAADKASPQASIPTPPLNYTEI